MRFGWAGAVRARYEARRLDLVGSAASRRAGEIAGRRMLYIKVRYKGSIKAACIKLASIRMFTSAPMRRCAALAAARIEYNLHVCIDRSICIVARRTRAVLAIKGI